MPQETLTKSARARIKDKAKIEAMEAQLAASQRQVEALKKDRERRLERLERRASHQGDGAGGPSNAPPPQAHAQEPHDGLQAMIDGLACSPHHLDWDWMDFSSLPLFDGEEGVANWRRLASHLYSWYLKFQYHIYHSPELQFRAIDVVFHRDSSKRSIKANMSLIIERCAPEHKQVMQAIASTYLTADVGAGFATTMLMMYKYTTATKGFTPPRMTRRRTTMKTCRTAF